MRFLLTSALLLAASGLDLPDVQAEVEGVGDLLSQIPGNVSHLDFGVLLPTMVQQPDDLLPNVTDISEMSSQESATRSHWFIAFFLLEFTCVALVGTVVMALPRCRASKGVTKGFRQLDVETPSLQAEEVPDKPSGLDEQQQRLLVAVAFGFTVLGSFAASLFSLSTQRLSKDTGLDWEVYGLLLLGLGAGLLIQAAVAVSQLPRGSYFKLTSFAQAAALSMAPLLSDSYDTLKDAVFGALCLQSDRVGIQCMGVLAWIYLVGIHVYFVANKRCLAELASTYLPVLLTPAHSANEPRTEGQGCCMGLVLPAVYKQLTPTKCKLLCIENGPQAVFAFIYLHVVGGSMFVAILNLAVPAGQILLALALFRPVRDWVVPSLATKLSEALTAGNKLAAQKLWEEAEFDNASIFKAGVPFMPFSLEVLGVEDAQGLDDKQLKIAYCIVGILCDLQVIVTLSGYGVTDRHVEALARALAKNNSVRELRLQNNQITEVGAKALAAALEGNETVEKVWLSGNKVGDRGVQAFAAALAKNSSVSELNLRHNQITEVGAEALAAALERNQTAGYIDLKENKIGDRGVQALEEVMQRKKAQSEELKIVIDDQREA